MSGYFGLIYICFCYLIGFGVSIPIGRIEVEEQGSSPFKEILDNGSRNRNNIGRSGSGDEISQSPEWETVLDPKLYIITEYDQNQNSLPNQTNNQNQIGDTMDDGGGGDGNDLDSVFSRLRRNNNAGHSLSIVNPLDVLRQRLLLEIARRRNLKQNQHQIIANAELLKNIG